MKVIGKIFAVLLSILYFVVLILFTSLIFVQKLSTGDFYSSILTSIDLDEIKLSDIDVTFDGMEHYEDETVADLLVEGLVDSGVEEVTAVEIVSNDNVKNLVGELIGEYVDYQINKENIPQIEVEDIKSIMSDMSIEASDDDIEELTNNINNILSKLANEEGVDDNGNS